MRLSRADLLTLQAYDWPGNVRELQNVIERAVIVSRGERLHFDLKTGNAERLIPENTATNQQYKVLTELEMQELVRRNIEAALKLCEGRIYGPQGAAHLLDVPPTTLSARIKNLGIRKN